MTPKAIIEQAIAEYGRPYWVATVPMSVRQSLSSGEIEQILTSASSNPDIIKSEDILIKTMFQWCTNNLFAHITHHDLAAILGTTSMQARTFINKNPERFRKLQRGCWEVRDPQSDKKIKQ